LLKGIPVTGDVVGATIAACGGVVVILLPSSKGEISGVINFFFLVS